MLNRISVNVLLKSVIATLAVAVMIALSLGAWNSWTRLTAVKRIATVADASGYLFTVLHNLRVDRSSTARDLNSDKPLAAISPMLKVVRDADLPALKSALTVLETADFPERQSAVASIGQAITKLTALHQETAAAVKQPKSERRQGLAQEFNNETDVLMALIEKTSSQLTNR